MAQGERRPKMVRLYGGERLFVAAKVEILDPEVQGDAMFAYYIWATEGAGSNGLTMEEAVQDSKARVFCFLTDNERVAEGIYMGERQSIAVVEKVMDKLPEGSGKWDIKISPIITKFQVGTTVEAHFTIEV